MSDEDASGFKYRKITFNSLPTFAMKRHLMNYVLEASMKTLIRFPKSYKNCCEKRKSPNVIGSYPVNVH